MAETINILCSFRHKTEKFNKQQEWRYEQLRETNQPVAVQPLFAQRKTLHTFRTLRHNITEQRRQ